MERRLVDGVGDSGAFGTEESRSRGNYLSNESRAERARRGIDKTGEGPSRYKETSQTQKVRSGQCGRSSKRSVA